MALLLSQNLYAGDNEQLFEKIFTNWTYAFNHQDITGSCQLFSKEVTANYQGVPQKNYAAICDGFKKIFAEKNKRYQYKFKLHQIYRENNLAAVRITWFLHTYKNQRLLNQEQDEGIDIFKKDNQGNWQIINYLGYPVK